MAVDAAPTDRRDVLTAALCVHLAALPLVLLPDEVADLLRVDVKVVYAAVRDHGLPMRRIGKVKCLRAPTLPFVLWLMCGSTTTGEVESNGQGRAAPPRKGRR